MSDKEEDNMAVRKEEVMNAKEKMERKKKILEMTHRASDKTEAALRRLSKN